MPYKDLKKKRKYNREYMHKWFKENPEKTRKSQRKWREKSKDKILEYQRKWCKQNPEKVNEHRLKQNSRKDIQFILAKNLRNRLRLAIKNNQKVGSSVKDLGYSIDEFKLYIENQFNDDMTWKNYGKVWELDHVMPLCHFDLSNRMELLEACNWLNIRPLTIIENRRRGKVCGF